MFYWFHVRGNSSTLIADARKLAEKIKKKGGESLLPIKQNLVDIVWGDHRPARPQEKIKVHPFEYSGKNSEDKLDELREELEKKKSAGIVICEPCRMGTGTLWLTRLDSNAR